MTTTASAPTAAELVQLLIACMGETFVVNLSATEGPQKVRQWADGSLEPDEFQLKRMEKAYIHWLALEATEGAAAARAWFENTNPWLPYSTPMRALMEGWFGEVAIAAKALALGSSGAFSPEALPIAKLLYDFAPELQNGNGDAYGFEEVFEWQEGWTAPPFNRAARAVKQAEALLASGLVPARKAFWHAVSALHHSDEFQLYLDDEDAPF